MVIDVAQILTDGGRIGMSAIELGDNVLLVHHFDTEAVEIGIHIGKRLRLSQILSGSDDHVVHLAGIVGQVHRIDLSDAYGAVIL